MTSIRFRLLETLVVCLAFGAAASMAQDSVPALQFPQDPRQWINSPAWSLEQISGKAVLLYFFEEGCPKCRNRWPELNRLAESHADDPILFIAVSSGTDRDEIESYVQQSQVGWGVLLDPDRSIEKACGVGEVSLQNIMQTAIIGGDGKLRPGSWRDLEETVVSALRDAQWSVDPKSIPAALRSTWQQVEFKNYAAAAPSLKKALKSPKEELKTAAETLLAAVQPVIDEKIAKAEAAYDAEEKWTAFQAYSELTEQFKGYELPDTVAARKKELQSDPKIKVEAASMKTLLTALKQLESAPQRKKGVAALKKLAKDKPDTEAGRKAQTRLETLD